MAASPPSGIAMLSTHEIDCPYCGEPISLVIDASGGAQRYIEDCTVCCRPITVSLEVDDDGDAEVRVHSENDG
jgi:hypothetical protein